MRHPFDFRRGGGFRLLIVGLLLAAAQAWGQSAPVLLAHYKLNEELKPNDVVFNSVQGSGGPLAKALMNAWQIERVKVNDLPTGDSCYAARFVAQGNIPWAKGGTIRAEKYTGLDQSLGGRNSVSFWMKRNGNPNFVQGQILVRLGNYNLRFSDQWLGFNTLKTEYNPARIDMYGAEGVSASLANSWHHVAAVFVNGDRTKNKLWIDGKPQDLSEKNPIAPNQNNYSAGTEFEFSDQRQFAFDGMLDELRVYRGELNDTQVKKDRDDVSGCYVASTPAQGFMCVAPGTLNADLKRGRLFTQLVDQPFSLDVAVLKPDGQLMTDYAKDNAKELTVELVDCGKGKDCTEWKALTPPVSGTLTLPIGSNGRGRLSSFQLNRAYANLRCRVSGSNPDTTSIKWVSMNSTDAFSVRPQEFSITSNMANASVGPTETPSLKAGSLFSLTAKAAPGYAGEPKIDITKSVEAHADTPVAGTLYGSFPVKFPDAGEVTGDKFNYSEVGYFRMGKAYMTDSSFTAIDQPGDCTDDFSNTPNTEGKIGCKFGNAVTAYFGRFVPDRFALKTAPDWEAGCDAFTYMEQPFKTALAVTVQAQNAAGVLTQNYQGAYAAGNVTLALNNQDGKTIEAARLPLTDNGPWAKGEYPLKVEKFSRPNAKPDGPFDALDIGLMVSDANAPETRLITRNMSAGPEVGCTPDLIGLSTDAGVCSAVRLVEKAKLRFGRLNLDNVYGSERLALQIPVTAQYWEWRGLCREYARQLHSADGGQYRPEHNGAGKSESHGKT